MSDAILAGPQTHIHRWSLDKHGLRAVGHVLSNGTEQMENSVSVSSTRISILCGTCSGQL